MAFCYSWFRWNFLVPIQDFHNLFYIFIEFHSFSLYNLLKWYFMELDLENWQRRICFRRNILLERNSTFIWTFQEKVQLPKSLKQLTKESFIQTEKGFALSKSFWRWSPAVSSSSRGRKTSSRWSLRLSSHWANCSDGRANSPKFQSSGSASLSKAIGTCASDESARSASPKGKSSHFGSPAGSAYWCSVFWSAFGSPQMKTYRY